MPVSSENISDVQNTVQQYMEKDAAGNAKCIICGKQAVDGRLRNLEYHIETHLEGLSFPCQLCGKVEASRNKWQNLRNHIETHLEGLSFPCQLCGKTFRSRNAFNAHKTRNHKFS